MSAPAPIVHDQADADKFDNVIPSKKTRYEVQLRVGAADENLWKPVGVVVASSARTAIREMIETQDLATGPMRAIPVRNITQVVVTFETFKQLTLT